MSKLRTEVGTKAMGRRVLSAFRALHPEFSDHRSESVFEHGQWWVTVDAPSIDYGDHYWPRNWSCVDASGRPDTVCDGFAFEEI